MDLRFGGKRLYLLAALLLFVSLYGCSTKYIITSPQYNRYKGEINQHTRLIRAERNRIFQILTQEEAFKEICPKGIIVTHKSPPPYRVGLLIKTRIVHIVTLDWNSRVEEIIPDKKIRLQFLDGFFTGGTEIWELDSVDEYTRVAHTIIVQPEGFFKNLAWIFKVRLKHDKIVEALLDNLKKVSETL
ncbi:MAG TPA: hypothetical protein VMW09_01235 [Desulfatiglandales bacterium]|nr:hypothetical protein [Desulfatiglandales bacterium]